MEKITKKQMFEGMIAYFKGEDTAISEVQFAEFCEKQIVDLDKKAAKSKERAAAKKAEGDVLTQVVLDCLTDEVEAIAVITERVAAQEGCEDVTVGKVQYRLGALAREGKAVKGEVVIPATETSKKRTVSGYSRR